MKYNWQFPNWPEFEFDLKEIQPKLIEFSELTGRTDGLLTALSPELKTEAIIDLMVAEALKSSEIEGEFLSRPDIRSSIQKNLGLVPDLTLSSDWRVAGIAHLMAMVRETFAEPLSKKVICDWHTALLSGATQINVGGWRTHEERMLIISGGIGSQEIHYEAPPSNHVAVEMTRFIQWFNRTARGEQNEILYPTVRAAIAHLYFESIHPFEDGNGRIGRAIAEKALSQGLKRPVLLSLSQTLELNRSDYYAELKKAQRTLNITEWISWFTDRVIDAQKMAESQILFSLKKAQFFSQFKDQLNERQLKVVKRMLKEGFDGFQGGMSTKKYMAITKTTKATATRDLRYLADNRVFISSGAGRSVRYDLNL